MLCVPIYEYKLLRFPIRKYLFCIIPAIIIYNQPQYITVLLNKVIHCLFIFSVIHSRPGI